MNSITRATKFGLPAIVGLGIAWFVNRILINEEGLKNRELELKLQLNTKSIKTTR